MTEPTLADVLDRIARMEASLAEQGRRLADLESRRPESPPTPAPAVALKVTPISPAPPTPAPAPAKAPPAVPPAAAPAAARAAPTLEARIGGAWLNWVGIVAVVIGAGFFLKYAFDNEWIGPSGRIAIGILAGLGLIAGGEVAISRRMRLWGQGLVGGGIAVLYLSLFAAFSLYALLPQPAAFAGMAVVTTGAAVLALREDAQALAILGLLGGFLTPVMLSTGQDNQVGLMSYMIVLDLGLVGVAFRRSWTALNHLCFVATEVLLVGWSAEHFTREKAPLTLGFVTAFYAIFTAAPLVYHLLWKRPVGLIAMALVFVNGAAYFGWGLGLLEQLDANFLRGPFVVALAAAYVGQGYLARDLLGRDRRLLFVLMGLALTLLTVAIPIQLESRWVTIAWAVEAAALLYAGVRAPSGKLRVAAAVVFVVALASLLMSEVKGGARDGDAVMLLNARALRFAVTGGLLLAAMALSKRVEPGGREDGVAASAYGLLGHLVLLALLVSEVALRYDRLVGEAMRGAEGATPEVMARVASLENAHGLAISGVIAAYGAALVVGGLARASRSARALGLAILAVAAVKVFVFDLQHLDRIYRILSFMGLGVALLAISFLYQRRRAAAKASVVVLAILGAAGAARADFEASRWRWERLLSGPSKPGLATVALDEPVYTKAREDLADLRVTSEPGGAEVPYVLLAARGRAEEEAHAARLQNLVTFRGEKTSFELEVDLGREGASYNEIELSTGSHNFRRRVSVEGAAERSAPFGMIRDDAQVFDFSGDVAARYLRVRLSEVSFRLLRVTIHDDGEPPLEGIGASVYLRKEPVKALERHEPASVRRSEDAKARRTELTVDLGGPGIPVERIDLTCEEGSFARGVEVLASDRDGPDARFERAGTGYVFRYERGGRRFEGLSLELRETRARFLKVAILNGDDRPLSGAVVHLRGAARRLVLERPPGAAELRLRYGNEDARAPEYDLARRAGIDSATELSALPALALGAESESAAWRPKAPPPVPPKPWSEEHPAVLWGAMGAAMLFLLLLVWRALASKTPASPGGGEEDGA